MPQGVPTTVPDDGLTTRQRRNMPVLAVHTGEGKGKSTAARTIAALLVASGTRAAAYTSRRLSTVTSV